MVNTSDSKPDNVSSILTSPAIFSDSVIVHVLPLRKRGVQLPYESQVSGYSV